MFEKMFYNFILMLHVYAYTNTIHRYDEKFYHRGSRSLNNNSTHNLRHAKLLYHIAPTAREYVFQFLVPAYRVTLKPRVRWEQNFKTCDSLFGAHEREITSGKTVNEYNQQNNMHNNNNSDI